MKFSHRAALAWTSLSLGCCLFASEIQAQSTVPEQALRELNIMENIFSAAMEDKNNRRSSMGPPESVYLAGQGMLFIFNLPGGNFWSGGGNNFFNGENFDFDFNFDFDNNGSAKPIVPEKPIASIGNTKIDNNPDNDYRQQLQALSEKMRDKQEAMRDQQRKMRDLQREQRSDSEKNKQAEIDSLAKTMASLGEEMAKLGNNMGQLRQDFQSKLDAAAEAKYKQQNALIFETLCKYGNTLQSLKPNEHVDLVLRNYGGKNKVQVYVVDESKLKNCNSGEKLLQEAKAYSM